MTIRAVVFDIGGVLEITPPTGWVEKYAVRSPSSGEENALEGEDCGSIDSSSRAGS